MQYKRVVPRDFFNEAKLLKCLGQFQLCVLDMRVPIEFDLKKLKVEFDGKPFDIHQHNSDGSFYCENYRVFLDGEELTLSTPLNSKENYPLEAVYKGEIYYVFDDKGRWMPNFGVMKK